MSEHRQIIRSLFQQPVFAITALMTIALGIGANAAVFTLVHAVLLEPLPFREPEALVQVWETHRELHNLQAAVPDYRDWQKSVKTLDLAAYTFQAINKTTLLGRGEPVAIQATNASSELFPLLGIKPLVGRLYGSDEERGKQPVILISEQLWRRKFSANPQVIGKSLQLGAASFTIVGVLHRENAFPVWADVWLPLALIEPQLGSTRKYHPLEVIGRLKPGASVSQAEMELERAARALSVSYPETNNTVGAFVVPLKEAITGDVRNAMLAVWLAVGLVLLIACVNLAHLMMGRTLNRRHEISIRLSLGASRLAVSRVFLLEATVLSLAGGALGLVVAVLSLPLFQRLSDGRIPRLSGVGLNFDVLLFGLLASLVTALFFALPAYLQVFRSDINETISRGPTRGSSAQGSELGAVLMSSEVAFSFAILFTTILLVRSFSQTLQIEPGFETKDVIAVHTPLIDGDWQKSYEFFRNRVAPELRAIAGVQDVAAVNSLPMSLGTTEHSRFATRFGIAGIPSVPGHFPTAQIRWCTANYFKVLGVPLLSGRLLIDDDHNQPRYVVNRAFASRYFPNSNAVGKKILLNVVSLHPDTVEIVGVVGDVREFGLTAATEPTLYLLDVSTEMDVLVKANAAERGAIAVAMRRIDPQQAIGPVKRLADDVFASLARERFILSLTSTFAGLALCLCAVGMYGVFSYSVSRRMREFGVRAAVGARAIDLVRQVLRECLAVSVPGVIAGMALYAGCSQFLRTLLYKVSPTDPFACGLAVLFMFALSLGSVMVPARRAANADPASMLRES